MTLSDDLDAHGHHESGEHSSDSFTTVNHSKNATYKRRAGKVKGKGAERTVPERLASRRETLERTGYLADFTNLLKEAFAPKDHEERIEAKPGGRHSCPLPSCVVCLGLGSIAESSKSQDQYILLQTLLDELGVASSKKPVIYDPVFSEADMAFLAQHGFQVLTSEHSLQFDSPTLLYMPHCPRSLFNDLFRLNWSVEQLSRLVILGNRLDMYDDPSHPSATSSAKAPYVVKIIPLLESVNLPPDKTNFDVFNDLSLQWIPSEKLLGLDEEFWNFDPSKLPAVPLEIAKGRKKRGKGGEAETMGLEKLNLTEQNQKEQGWSVA